MTINKIMQEITQNPLKNYFEEIDRLEKEDSKQNSKFVSWRKCEKTEKVALITKFSNLTLKIEQPTRIDIFKKTRSTSPEEAKLNKRQAIKTKMCRNMMLHGNCKYGEKCSFAHKEEDLQGNSSKPPNYKTKLC
jgi:predicted nuclease with TOPRIM domain